MTKYAPLPAGIEITFEVFMCDDAGLNAVFHYRGAKLMPDASVLPQIERAALRSVDLVGPGWRLMTAEEVAQYKADADAEGELEEL